MSHYHQGNSSDDINRNDDESHQEEHKMKMKGYSNTSSGLWGIKLEGTQTSPTNAKR